MGIKDSVVVITGASRGLGKALAVEFSKRGATVVVSSREKRELEKVAGDIGAAAIVCDVTDEAQVDNLVVETVKRFGRLDIMVNNAGILAPRVQVPELDSEWVHKMMEVNFFGTMYGSKHALRQMLQQGSGAIVNIVSTSGLTARAGSVGYAATKFAATGFTRGLALEVEGQNILVLGVYPGGMKTDLFGLQTVPEQDYDAYMEVSEVAEKVVAHLETAAPSSELVVRRPSL